MDATYYRFVRREIEPLLPATATRILDVGSGEGLTAAWVKSRYPGSTTLALEGNPALRETLARNVDEARIVDLNGPLPDVGAPDLALFLDVLEHLVHPWEVLARLTAGMPENSTIIVSVPNIAHWSVSLPLLLKGSFDYRDAGILDRTHLRFFVLRSAISLLNTAGFTVRHGLRGGLTGPRTQMLNLLTFGTLRNQLTRQFVLAGSREAMGVKQGPVAFRPA